MDEREVVVLCHWNGCIKYGPDGVYYEGATLRKIRVHQKTKLSRLVEGLYLITGLDKQKTTFDIVGRYPVVFPLNLLRYVHLPVVDDTSLEKMLELPSIHPSITNVELYLEVNPGSDIDPAGCSPPLVNSGSSLKRQRIDIPVKLERIEEEAEVGNGRDGDMIDSSPHVVNVTGDGSKDLNKNSSSGVKKPCLSSLWLDDHDFRAGLCFRDSDELKKAVEWCSIKGMQKCVKREIGKDEYLFECVRWKCKWTLRAARMKSHGLFEIIKYTGPHTCRPIEPKKSDSEVEADEIERVVRVHPTQSFAELQKWWKGKFDYELDNSAVLAAKEEAIKRVFGDWDQSFEVLPKLMSALGSSNGLVMDWKYDLFPNPKFASFSGVFWTFPQSVEGFTHCRPLMVVGTKDLDSKYPMKLMIASGIDAKDYYFPLAFAVTKEVSTDSWRWFLSEIRKKVTQREGLCLISSHHPDILAAINEPGSQWNKPWAYHRFCLKELLAQFDGDVLKSLVEQAGWSYQKVEFDSYMKEIKEKNLEAWRWLDKIPPHQWALAHDNGRKYGFMEISTEDLLEVCEGFELADHGVIGYVVLMFDKLRDIFENLCRASSAKLKGGAVYTTPVTNKLEESKISTVTYVVMPLESNTFHITAAPENADKWIVRLSDCTCTCGGFQSDKYPCLHGLAVCKKLKINPLQYVDDYYTFERYHKTYSAKFNPVPEFVAWPEASGVPTLFPPVIPPPPPPKVKSQPHRETTLKTAKKT